MTKSRIKKVVIPAAGLGTRFLPASKVVPKELFTVVDRPILQYNVEEAIAAGISEVILVVSPRKRGLEDYFRIDRELEEFLKRKGNEHVLESLQTSRLPVKVTTVVQEEAKGLGDAILVARDAVGDEPFAVLLPDDMISSEVPCLGQMLPAWEKDRMGCIAVRNVPLERVNQYGIVSTKSSEGRWHRVSSVVEKPPASRAASTLAVIGRYLLPPSIFGILETTAAGALGEIQLTDALQVLAGKGELVACEFEGEYFDAGSRFGFVAANIFYGLKRDDIRGPLVEFIRETLR